MRDELEYLLDELKNADFTRREVAEKRLLQLPDRQRAVAPLIEYLKRDNWVVRNTAASLLGRLGDKSAITPLIESLHDEFDFVRAAAAWALGGLEATEAVVPLITALEDESDAMRVGAAWSLGVIGDSRAKEALQRAIKDENDISARELMAVALAQFGDFEYAALLINQLQRQLFDKEKERIAVALERWGTPEALEAVRQWQASRSNT
ncbi:MAG: HEAT repeat domain-containing protein [Anaerolineae bacterium]